MPDTAILIALGAVIGTTVLLTLGLSAGFWAGLQAATRSLVEELATLKRANEDHVSQLGALSSAIEASHEQSEVVGLLARAAPQAALPTDLKVAIDCMVETMRSLEHKIQELQAPDQAGPKAKKTPERLTNWELPRKKPSAGPPPRKRETATPTDSSLLTKQEMCDVMAGRHPLGDSPEEFQSRRYTYDCLQQLAPWPEGEPEPDEASYMSVRCHDLSVSGISFLWHEAPDFTQAVISVGPKQSPIFMIVQVARYKAVVMHDRVSFLVETDFVRRLERAACEARECSEEPDYAGV